MKKNGHDEMAVLMEVKLSTLLNDNIKKPRRVRGVDAAKKQITWQKSRRI